MPTSDYFWDPDNRFIVEQYNDKPPFASFLPGIAGTLGRPAWVFYVNRGQGLASFGVRNKDGAFLEFFPADKAYQLTASRGFRSFLKISDGDKVVCYEPFLRGGGPQIRQRLIITAHEFGVEEINPDLALTLRAEMFTLPQAPVAALVRRVEVINQSANIKRIEIVDGLPQVQPYAMNQWILKFMSRTSEAFMRVEGVERQLPFYRLKVWPTDSPQVEPVLAGNFFLGLHDGQRNRVIVDPERVFGLAGDFSSAERFFAEQPLALADQVLGNQTPSAFQTLTLQLQPGESQVFYGVYGHATSLALLEQIADAARQPGYLEGKRQENRQLLDAISRRAFTATAKPLFDAHAQQCYLDNGLRGGFSQAVPGGAHLYLFGRKHGDLERDYNDFLLQDTVYSEGNGDFRDVLQNRRMDLFFDPALDDKNIHYFFNLIQPDGYNPCSLRNSRFVVPASSALADYLTQIPGLAELLTQEFKYAQLWQVLEAANVDVEAVIGAILAQAQEVEDAEFDRGYWSDHWTYLLDLLLSYQAIFPDRLTGLLLQAGYSFFDPTHYLANRAQKYQLTANGLRQYGAVQFSAEKKALIESRSRLRYRVRDNHGHGEIVYTTLLGKILTLVANKLATLDPFGVGIEMEADRPGWCDALNGLPGILGSAINETIELKRLVDFTRKALATVDVSVALPGELADFITALTALLDNANLTAERFWRDSGALKERYRAQVFMGFAGSQPSLTLTEVQQFLASASRHLGSAIAKASTPEGIVSYFAYQAEDYRDNGNGQIEVRRFRPHALPLFLEGFVHALRIAQPDEARRLLAAARNSELYDQKLGMYRLNAPLGEQALDLGRIGVFNYGWLENGSIFLHMHYKMVLEILRAGRVEDFYAEMENLLVAFHDPADYKRCPIENSSFLVSSGFSIDPRQHGRGCVARLSGATVEFLQLWTHLFLGGKPFVFDDGQLRFQPQPLLASSMFAGEPRTVQPFDCEEVLPANHAACTLFGDTLLVYINPGRQNSFGLNAVQPLRYRLYSRSGDEQTLQGPSLPSPIAEELRQGKFRRLDVELG